jgi:hypothetical protein
MRFGEQGAVVSLWSSLCGSRLYRFGSLAACEKCLGNILSIEPHAMRSIA